MIQKHDLMSKKWTAPPPDTHQLVRKAQSDMGLSVGKLAWRYLPGETFEANEYENAMNYL